MVDVPANGNSLFSDGVGRMFFAFDLRARKQMKLSCRSANARESGGAELHTCTHRPPQLLYCHQLRLFFFPSQARLHGLDSGGRFFLFFI